MPEAAVDSDLCPPAKVPRLEECLETPNGLNVSVLCRLDKMKFVSVLRNDSRAKSVVLHTRFEDKDAIVLLEKSVYPTDLEAFRFAVSVPKPDETSTIPDQSKDSAHSLKADHVLSNDVYHRFLVTAGLECFSDINMTVIYPAEEHHFKRFTSGGRRVFQESPEMYKDVIVPFLAQKPRDLSWVENILTGKSEVECVLYSDPDPSFGFTLVKDYRWDGKTDITLHYLAIARDGGLTCLRDLRSAHIPMLTKILSEGRKCISEKYPSINADQLVAYFHYPPTFYWLHVHFVHSDSNDETLRAGRAHLLEEVIRNLQSNDLYYVERTMTICLHEASPMLNVVREATRIPPSGDKADDA